jgi:hypothetical protein
MKSAAVENHCSETIFPEGWTVENGFRVIDSKGRLVADCSPRATSPDLEECKRNARLIALVPKLVDRLQVLIDYLSESHQEEIDTGHGGDDEEGHECSYCEALGEAKSLIEEAGNR